VLTPNPAEAGLLLGRDLSDLEEDLAAIAAQLHATVSCQGVIAAPDGRIWLAGTGQGGLGTSAAATCSPERLAACSPTLQTYTDRQSLLVRCEPACGPI